jgi:hypothetical protein
LPLLTLDSMPKAPRLRNRDRSKGPRVSLRVLAFPMPMAAKEKWAEDNQIGIGKNALYKRDHAWSAIISRLSPRYCQYARVPVEGPHIRGIEPGCCHAIVVASNSSVKELKRAEDIETIRSVQRFLGATEPPQWYYPGRSWYERFASLSFDTILNQQSFRLLSFSSWMLFLVCYAVHKIFHLYRL